MNLEPIPRVARRPEARPALLRGDTRSRWAAERVGAVLGDRWTLHDVIGSGATAAVFRAQHRNGHRVAVKMLHPELARDREVVRRFVREAYIANRVDHPCIVRVLDDGFDVNGSPFLVMDLVDGESLADVVEREGPLAPVHAARVTERLLDVLAAAHAAGVVHRDVKPANVILAKDATVRILDFGIARVREGGDAATRDGWVLGTPAFMSPEQAHGIQARIDARADVFSAGALLFTLLTGRTIRDEATSPQQALLFAMDKPVPPVAGTHPSIPAGIAAVVDRALLLDPRTRWQSAVAMKEALERIARDPKEVPFTQVVEGGPVLEAVSSHTSKLPSAPPAPLPLFTGIRGATPPTIVSPPAQTFAASSSLASPTMVARHNRTQLARVTGALLVVLAVAGTAALVALGGAEPVVRPRPAPSAAPVVTMAAPPSAPTQVIEEASPAAAPGPSFVPPPASVRTPPRAAASASSAPDFLGQGRF